MRAWVRPPVVVAVLLGLFVALLAVGAFGQLAAADSHDGDDYVVEQGDQCIDVDPYVEPDQTVEEFYGYDPGSDSDSSGSDWSSLGTVEQQQDDASIVILHEGADGLSLVVVHDQYHDETEDGTDGGAASLTVTGITPGDAWEVEDDHYDGDPDEWNHRDSSSEIHWSWWTSRTDGGAYTGLGEDLEDGEVGIEPAFNEDAELYPYSSNEGYHGDINDWQVISAVDGGDDFERNSLDSLDEEVTIRQGSCEDYLLAPGAEMFVDEHTPEIGEDPVTLDASDTEADGDVDGYRWDVTGDGSTDFTSDEPVVEHVFEDDVGEREVTVTVVDEAGQEDSASETVTVRDDSPPTAVLRVPTDVTAGESIELSGAESTDNHEIAGYGWYFDDGETAEGETIGHTFDEPGDHVVQLVVVDESGNEDATTTTVEVDGSGGDDGDVGGSPSTPPGPVEASVDVDGDTVRLSTSVDAGQTFEADLGHGDDVRLDAVEYEAGESADDLEVDVALTDEVAPGQFTRRAVYETDADAALAGATYEFTVDRAAMDRVDLEESDLAVYARGDGGWEQVDADVESGNERVAVTASVDGDAPVAVGSETDDLEAPDGDVEPTGVDVDPATIDAGDEAAVQVSVANDGDETAREDVELRVGETVVDSQTVTLVPGEETTVDFEQRFDSAGTYEVGSGDETTSITVEESSDGITDADSLTGGDGSGFGPAVALVALVASVAVARRRA